MPCFFISTALATIEQDEWLSENKCSKELSKKKNTYSHVSCKTYFPIHKIPMKSCFKMTCLHHASKFLLHVAPVNKNTHNYCLTDRRHMSNVIPFILRQEKDPIKRGMNGKRVSIVFDGTSRVGEIL